MVSNTTENVIEKMTKKYSNFRFINSGTKGLYYAVAPDDDRIAILCGGGIALCTLEQLYTMTKEAIDVWTLNIDRNASIKQKAVSSFDNIIKQLG